MMMHMFLAHGVLGQWDELVFVGVAVIFFAMMGLSWYNSRGAYLDGDEAAVPQAEAPDNAPDHFRLE